MSSRKQPRNEAGFSIEHFTKAELADLDRALGQSLLGEIGMLRVVMRRFFERAAHEAEELDALAEVIRVLGLSCTRLARLIQTDQGLEDKRADELGDSLTHAMAAVLEEMGSAGLNGHSMEESQDG
jgi:hypothetical protein